MTSFFHVVPITFHTSVPLFRKCMDTSRKKSILAESASIRASPAAPLRRTTFSHLLALPFRSTNLGSFFLDSGEVRSLSLRGI